MSAIGPSFQTHWPEQVVTKVAVLSSADIVNNGDTASNFTLSLPSRVYDVLGIKLVALDIAFPRSDATPPNPTSIFLSINDIRHVMSSNSRVDGCFAYVTPLPTNSFANETTLHYTFKNDSGGIDDPYTYMFTPATSSLEKISIRLSNPDGSLYVADSGKVTVTLLLYTRFSKLTRF